MRSRYSFALAGLAIFGIYGAAKAEVDVTFERLLSYVFFEDEIASTDPKTFFCSNIALPHAEDTCNASFRIVDENSCKIEVVREFRATWGDGKGREHMRAKELFTVANLNLARTAPTTDPDKHTTLAVFESDIDIYRHEGYQFAVDLDDKGQYKACRIDDASVTMPEEECVLKGTKSPSTSKKMKLLFSQSGYTRAMTAVRYLQAKYCPAGGNKL